MKEFHGPSEKTHVQGWDFVPAEFQRLCISRSVTASQKKGSVFSVLYTGSFTPLLYWSHHNIYLYCTNSQQPNLYWDPIVFSTFHAGWEIKASTDRLQTAWDEQECCWDVLVQRASQWECQGLKTCVINWVFSVCISWAFVFKLVCGH